MGPRQEFSEFAEMEMQRKIASLTALALNYGKDFPKALVKVWLRLLEPYSAVQVETGVEKVIAEYEYKTLPPFAVLNKAIRDVCGLMEPGKAQEVAALSEWENLLESASKYGRYNQPALDGRTERVVRLMGGWSAVCDWETSKLEWKQKEFLDHWQKIAEHGDTMALPANDILALGQGGIARGSRVGGETQRNDTHISGALENALQGMARAV